MSLDWSYGKVVELDDGTWWIALYYRWHGQAEWIRCWRNLTNHARWEPFETFTEATGMVRGHARTALPEEAFTELRTAKDA